MRGGSFSQLEINDNLEWRMVGEDLLVEMLSVSWNTNCCLLSLIS
jgi:hypothetical protein